MCNMSVDLASFITYNWLVFYILTDIDITGQPSNTIVTMVTAKELERHVQI